MLRKLVSAALRRDVPEDDAPVGSGNGAVLASQAPNLDFPPMRSLRPPAAENDNPLAAFCPVVEQSLQAAGYLD